jgi:hypothetical protein
MSIAKSANNIKVINPNAQKTIKIRYSAYNAENKKISHNFFGTFLIINFSFFTFLENFFILIDKNLNLNKYFIFIDNSIITTKAKIFMK